MKTTLLVFSFLLGRDVKWSLLNDASCRWKSSQFPLDGDVAGTTISHRYCFSSTPTIVSFCTRRFKPTVVPDANLGEEMADKLVCVLDFEKHAHKVLPNNALDYYRTGADQEQTLRDNRQAFLRYLNMFQQIYSL